MPYFYFEDLWLDCQKLYLRGIHNKTWFIVGFLKLFLDFEILYIKIFIETYGRTVFFAFKTRLGNNFQKVYGKKIEKNHTLIKFVIKYIFLILFFSIFQHGEITYTWFFKLNEIKVSNPQHDMQISKLNAGKWLLIDVNLILYCLQ